MTLKSETPFKIDVQRGAEFVIARLIGSCTMDVAQEAVDGLGRLAAEPVDRVVVDLSELVFIESSGLGALVAAHGCCQRRDADFCLVSPRASIRRMLVLTHLSDVLPICDTLESALKRGP